MKAERPMYSVLDLSKIKNCFDIDTIPCKDNLTSELPHFLMDEMKAYE